MKATEPADSTRELLEIEHLVPRHARRITVRDHERWQATGRPPHENDADLADLIDELRDVERRHRR